MEFLSLPAPTTFGLRLLISSLPELTRCQHGGSALGDAAKAGLAEYDFSSRNDQIQQFQTTSLNSTQDRLLILQWEGNRT